jgi:hypothetical protein
MNFAVRCGALAAVLVLASACADPITPTGPTTPTGTTPSPPTPRPGSDFPAVSRPARIYLFASGLSHPVREWTSGSRYVLYDDGTFALQYLQSQGSFEYLGTYTQMNALITFHWQANQNVPAPWRPATGTLSDDSLTVRYDAIMNLDDFEDAVYIRTQ